MRAAVCALALLCLAAAVHAEIIGDIEMQRRSAELQSQAVIAAKASSNTTVASTNTADSDTVVDISGMQLPAAAQPPNDTQEPKAAAAAAAPVSDAKALKPSAGDHQHVPSMFLLGQPLTCNRAYLAMHCTSSIASDPGE
jgi:hypothetical protein